MATHFKHAIITGGSSGIGQAVAKILAQQGTSLSIIARDPVKLKQTEDLLNSLKAHPDQIILSLPADVANIRQINEAIEQSIATNGTPDLLITSAGIAEPGYFNELSDTAFMDAMNINYFGTLYAVRAIAPLMMKQQHGQIMMVSSMAGIIGILGYSAYTPSKFALRGFAEAIRGELKANNVFVSVLYPPDTDTPQLHKENETKPKETKLIGGKLHLWSADDVAREMIEAINKKKFTVVPGTANRILTAFSSLLSPILNRYQDYLIKKARNS